MTSYLVVTIVVFVAIGIGAWLTFKRMDDRFK